MQICQVLSLHLTVVHLFKPTQGLPPSHLLVLPTYYANYIVLCAIHVMLHIIQSDYRYVKCLKDNLLYKLEMSISTVVVLLDSLLHS